jgi:hypothetical protein
MLDAFEQVAAAQDSPASPEGAATTEPGAETDPNAVSADVHAKAKPQGPIPFEVHQKALENARTKAVAEFREQPAIRQAGEFAARITQNATGFWGEYTRELLAHPEHGQVLRAELGRMFGSLRAPAQPQAQQQPMPEPDIQIVDAQGHVTGMTYSDKQLAARDDWRERQLLEKVNARMLPIEQERAAKAAEAKTAEVEKQVTAATDQHLTRIDKILDGRKDLYTEVNALLAKDPSLDALDAAFQVRDSHIVPTQGAEAERKALDKIKQKAAGNTAGNSGAATPLTRPKSEAELAEFMRSLAR